MIVLLFLKLKDQAGKSVRTPGVHVLGGFYLPNPFILLSFSNLGDLNEININDDQCSGPCIG